MIHAEEACETKGQLSHANEHPDRVPRHPIWVLMHPIWVLVGRKTAARWRGELDLVSFRFRECTNSFSQETNVERLFEDFAETIVLELIGVGFVFGS